MANQSGSADPIVPSNMLGINFSPAVLIFKPTSLSLIIYFFFGPNGQYSKVVRKGNMRVEPKLSANNYLAYHSSQEIALFLPGFLFYI